MLDTSYEQDVGARKVTQKPKKALKKNVNPSFRRIRPECKIESFHTTGVQKNLTFYVRTDFARNAKP